MLFNAINRKFSLIIINQHLLLIFLIINCMTRNSATERNSFKTSCLFQTAMTEYSYELKIPKERVAVLIGKNGEIKKQLEAETNTKLKVDSQEGDVFVYGEDAITLFSVREIIRAIGRGFN